MPPLSTHPQQSSAIKQATDHGLVDMTCDKESTKTQSFENSVLELS